MNTKIENKIEQLSNDLVPASGKCKSIQGEAIRAFCKLSYRYYNDGDKYFDGYGCETAGPPHSFLLNCDEFPNQLNKDLRNALPENSTYSTIMSDDAYEGALELAGKLIIDWIDSCNYFTLTDLDMLDFVSIFCNELDGDEFDCFDCFDCGLESHSCICEDEDY